MWCSASLRYVVIFIEYVALLEETVLQNLKHCSQAGSIFSHWFDGNN
jgi:hypothetical protein